MTPAISLVCTSRGRPAEVKRLVLSLARQTLENFQFIYVQQTEEDPAAPLVAKILGGRAEVLRSPPCGLSRARNEALSRARAEFVSFPDDDCWYPPTLLADAMTRVQPLCGKLALTCGSRDESGNPSNARWSRKRQRVEPGNLMRTTIEYAMFLPSGPVRELGFDEQMGVGAATPWQSSEGADLLLRLMNRGIQVVYDPDLSVFHRDPRDRSLQELCKRYLIYGRGMGYFYRKHGLPVSGCKMWARAVAGAVVSVMRLDRKMAAAHFCSAVGRLQGLCSR